MTAWAFDNDTPDPDEVELTYGAHANLVDIPAVGGQISFLEGLGVAVPDVSLFEFQQQIPVGYAFVNEQEVATAQALTTFVDPGSQHTMASCTPSCVQLSLSMA